jgi:hypothetical protein
MSPILELRGYGGKIGGKVPGTPVLTLLETPAFVEEHDQDLRLENLRKRNRVEDAMLLELSGNRRCTKVSRLGFETTR